MARKSQDALLLGFAGYLADRARPLSKKTRYNYRTRVARAVALAEKGGYSLFSGDKRVVRYVLGQLPPHPSTQNGAIAALRVFYDFLRAEELRWDNPAREIGRPKPIRGIPRPLDPADALRYVATAESLGPRHECVAVLGLYQGFRLAEIQYGEWGRLYRANGHTWYDVTGKGAKTARAPVHPRTLEMLARLREHHNDPQWLLPSPRSHGQPLSNSAIERMHRRICEEAGMRCRRREGGMVLHQLRHTFATTLLDQTDNLAVVQDALRHSSPVSTRIYADVFPEKLARAVESLDFGPQVGPEADGGMKGDGGGGDRGEGQAARRGNPHSDL